MKKFLSIVLVLALCLSVVSAFAAVPSRTTEDLIEIDEELNEQTQVVEREDGTSTVIDVSFDEEETAQTEEGTAEPGKIGLSFAVKNADEASKEEAKKILDNIIARGVEDFFTNQPAPEAKEGEEAIPNINVTVKNSKGQDIPNPFTAAYENDRINLVLEELFPFDVNATNLTELKDEDAVELVMNFSREYGTSENIVVMVGVKEADDAITWYVLDHVINSNGSVKLTIPTNILKELQAKPSMMAVLSEQAA